jgi:ribosomal protein S18 acetylase RimI-like enzyme
MRCYLTELDVALGDFVRAHAVTALARPTLDPRVVTIVREWLIVTERSGETILAACLQRDAADPECPSELVLLACADFSRLAPALEHLLVRAEQLVPGGAARLVEVQVPTMLEFIEPTLEGHGYRRAWQNLDFERADVGTCRPMPGRMPALAHWQDLDESTLDRARACYLRAFRDLAGAGAPVLTDYPAQALQLLPRARLLLLDDRVLAFTRVAWKDHAHRFGEVRNLGRDPDAPEQGLGALGLAEAVRALGVMGARRAMLTVASHNARAITLYRRFGFEERDRRSVLRKCLTG